MDDYQDKTEAVSTTESMLNYKHQCYICDKTFSANSNLNRHLRKIHKENVQSPYNNVKCALCDSVFSSSSIYNEHLGRDHGVKIETDHLTFPSKEAFEEWRHMIENETISQYIKSRGEKKSKNVNKTYYSCNRSGYYISKARTHKALKKQGSRKINGRCPASMNVTLNPGSTYDVRFVKTHVGHDFELKHLDISDKDRNYIIEKLASGLTKKEIIKEIRSAMESSDETASAMTGQDIISSDITMVETNRIEPMPIKSEIVISSENNFVLTKSQSSTPTRPGSSIKGSRLHLATTKDIHNIINSKKFSGVQIRQNSASPDEPQSN